VGEQVQIVFDKRGPNRSVLGIAEIIKKEPRCMAKRGCQVAKGDHCGTKKVTTAEAMADGFKDYFNMWEWFYDTYRYSDHWPNYHMHRIHLAWQQMWLYVPEQKDGVAKRWAALLGKGASGTQFLIRKDVLETIHNEAAKV